MSAKVLQLYLLCLFCWLNDAASAEQQDKINVAVSANFSAAFLALKDDLDNTCHVVSSYTFGSSGILASQFDKGAPFDVFLSADSDKPQWLFARNKTAHTPVTYAIGQLVLVDKYRDQLQPKDTAVALANTSSWRVAIANAATAPYGKAAEQVLSKVARASNIEVIRGNSVLQALQYILTGNASQAIVARSLVANKAHFNLAYTPIPNEWHEPIRQQMVVNKRTDTALARCLVDFFTSEATQSKLVDWGYLPVEQGTL